MKRMVDSELINSLGNDIKFDEMGNVTVGKNLEVGGNVFTLNGKKWGIMPVKSVNDSGVYSDMGFILSNILPHTNEDNTINVSGIWFNIANKYIKFYMSKNKKLTPGYNETHIEDGVLYISTHEIYKIEELFTTLLNSDYVSKTYQQKLYRHVISLSASSSADGTCRLEWISPNNLNCDSLEDLRILLKNPQMQSYVASNPSGDLFGVVISPSTAQIKKVGTTSLLNITSVSDTVTTL